MMNDATCSRCGVRHTECGCESAPPKMKQGTTYERLAAQVWRLQEDGELPKRPTRSQIVDWAYGNTAIDNEDITLDMVQQLVDKSQHAKWLVIEISLDKVSFGGDPVLGVQRILRGYLEGCRNQDHVLGSQGVHLLCDRDGKTVVGSASVVLGKAGVDD